MTNADALDMAISEGHAFNHKGKDVEPGIACLKCGKPLWRVCKERREATIVKCDGKGIES